MAKDLRSFLDDLRREDPEQVLEVEREVDCKFEVIALSEILEEKNKFPAVFYRNVRNLKGIPGSRVLVNLYGDRRRYPIAFGLPREEHKMAPVLSYIEALQNPIRPVQVSAREAPVKEVIVKGEQTDQRDLPIVHHHQEDGGPYITQPVLSKDPDKGTYNLAFHRTMIMGPDESAMLIGPTHTYDNIHRYKALSRPCPIAWVIGHHPMMGWAAMTRVPKNYSEVELTGGLLGEPVRMVPSETWGKEFLVPADAEIVIEGEIIPDQLVEEGPFGEWTGFIGLRGKRNFARVRAITRRRDPVLVTEPMGPCGLYGLAALPNEALYFKMARDLYPHVQAIHFPRSGNGFTTCYISVGKNSPRSEGEQKNVGLHLCFGRIKLIVMVDGDVDVFDEEKVLRAIVLRCQASLDLDVVRGMRGSLLDPSMVHPTTHDAVIIDATWKLDRRIPIKASLPASLLEQFRIEDYIRPQGTGEGS